MTTEWRPTEELATQLEAFVPTLSHVEQRISLELIRQLSIAKPASMKALGDQLDLSPAEVEQIVSTWTGVKRNREGNVIGYWGIDLEPTQHEMEIHGAKLYAWGAWDSLFLPELIEATVRVRSKCPETGQSLRIAVGIDGILESEPHTVLSFLFPPRGTPLHEIDVNDFCRFVHFFSSAAAGLAWCKRHPGTFLMTLEQGFCLGHIKNTRRYSSELNL